MTRQYPHTTKLHKLLVVMVFDKCYTAPMAGSARQKCIHKHTVNKPRTLAKPGVEVQTQFGAAPGQY